MSYKEIKMPYQGPGWYHESGAKLPDDEFKSKLELDKMTKQQIIKYLVSTLKEMGLLWISSKKRYNTLKETDKLGVRFLQLHDAIIERAMMSKKKMH
jgi:hypothetical protein